MLCCRNRRHFTVSLIVMVCVPIIILTKMGLDSLTEAEIPAVPQTKEQAKVSTESRTVKIKNNVVEKKLKYKYLFLTYIPTKFSITINDQELKQDEEMDVTIKDNKLSVRYDYEFMDGKRTGAKVVHFEVDPEAQELDLSFSWKDKWRVIIDGAEATSFERIEKEEKE